MVMYIISHSTSYVYSKSISLFAGTAPGALTTPSPHHNSSQQQQVSNNTNNNQQTSRQQIQVNNNPCISQSHTPPSSNTNSSGPPSQPPTLSGTSGKTGPTAQTGVSHQQPHPSPIPPHQPPNSGTSHGNWSATGGTLNYTANQNNMGTTGTAVTSGDWPSSASAYGTSQQRVGGSNAVAVNNVQQQHHTAHDNQGPLSKSPMPEFWCSILYFELDTQVRYNSILIQRISVQNSNVHRTEASDDTFHLLGWRNVQSSQWMEISYCRWICRSLWW